MKTIVMFFSSFFTLLFVTLTIGQDLNLTSSFDCLSVVSKQETCPHPDITFWLYNTNITAYQLDPTNNNTIINAPFLNNKTIFLLNGYNGNLNDYINAFVRPKYIDLGYNVISLYYYSLVPKPCYLQAVQNVDIISDCFKDFVKYILRFNKFSIQDVHVVAFSLGAQIAGEAAKLLKSDNITFPRLTGLDVAAPLFPISKINSASATFVDIIYTNGFFGQTVPIGHADFYVNNMILQPSCNFTDEGNFVLCSHSMACVYFGESFVTKPPVFCGKPIKLSAKSEIMGEYVSLNAKGVFNVYTNDTYPKDKSC